MRTGPSEDSFIHLKLGDAPVIADTRDDAAATQAGGPRRRSRGNPPPVHSLSTRLLGVFAPRSARVKNAVVQATSAQLAKVIGALSTQPGATPNHQYVLQLMPTVAEAAQPLLRQKGPAFEKLVTARLQIHMQRMSTKQLLALGQGLAQARATGRYTAEAQVQVLQWMEQACADQLAVAMAQAIVRPTETKHVPIEEAAPALEAQLSTFLTPDSAFSARFQKALATHLQKLEPRVVVVWCQATKARAEGASGPAKGLLNALADQQFHASLNHTVQKKVVALYLERCRDLVSDHPQAAQEVYEEACDMTSQLAAEYGYEGDQAYGQGLMAMGLASTFAAAADPTQGHPPAGARLDQLFAALSDENLGALKQFKTDERYADATAGVRSALASCVELRSFQAQQAFAMAADAMLEATAVGMDSSTGPQHNIKGFITWMADAAANLKSLQSGQRYVDAAIPHAIHEKLGKLQDRLAGHLGTALPFDRLSDVEMIQWVQAVDALGLERSSSLSSEITRRHADATARYQSTLRLALAAATNGDVADVLRAADALRPAAERVRDFYELVNATPLEGADAFKTFEDGLIAGALEGFDPAQMRSALAMLDGKDVAVLTDVLSDASHTLTHNTKDFAGRDKALGARLGNTADTLRQMASALQKKVPDYAPAGPYDDEGGKLDKTYRSMLGEVLGIVVTPEGTVSALAS